MKLVTFRTNQGELRPGALVGESVVDLLASDASLPRSVRAIIAEGAIGQAAEIADQASAIYVSDAPLQAPLSDPIKIICIGLNYRDHALETGKPIPEEPIVFSKYATALVGPGAPIRLPASSSQVDYEAELVAVVGREAKDVSEEEGLDYIAGYTIGIDVSARDWQRNKPGGQWMMGKTFDSFAPTGPAIVTRDEIPDPHALGIRLRLNGQTMQDSNTRELIFSVGKLVSYLSQVFTLEPGDLLFTGTPPGVGCARQPPVFLQPGDVCEVEIERLGMLRSVCQSA